MKAAGVIASNKLAGKAVDYGITRRIADRSKRPQRAFERLAVEPWVGTNVDSDRWWRLPAVSFSGGSVAPRTWRPPIAPDRHGESWVPQCVLAIERVIKSCDGKQTIEEIVRNTRDQFPAERAVPMQAFCNQVLADLLVLRMLV